MNRLFDVTCPRCHRVSPTLQIGVNSFLKEKCPHCQTTYYAKSTIVGVKTDLWESLKNK